MRIGIHIHTHFAVAPGLILWSELFPLRADLSEKKCVKKANRVVIVVLFFFSKKEEVPNLISPHAVKNFRKKWADFLKGAVVSCA